MPNATFELKVATYLNPVGVISSPTGQEQPLGFHQYPVGTVVEVDPATAGVLRNTYNLATEINKDPISTPPLIPQARHKSKRVSKNYRDE